MPYYPPCERCDLAELCLISQRENYRLRDLVYPFARAECEPPGAGSPAPEFPDDLPARRSPTKEAAALADAILDCLAGAAEPLTQADIARALDMTGPADYVRVKNALYKLKQAGQIRPVQGRTQKPARGRQPNLWVLG